MAHNLYLIERGYVSRTSSYLPLQFSFWKLNEKTDCRLLADQYALHPTAALQIQELPCITTDGQKKADYEALSQAKLHLARRSYMVLTR